MEKEAIESYQHALELDPKSAATHYNLGSLLALQGDLQRGSDHLRRALEYNPDYVEARNNLGNVLLLDGDVIGAADQFHAALRLNPTAKKLRFNLGVVLIKAGDFTAARKELAEFAKMSSDPFEAYRANVLLNKGRLDHGIDDLKQALKLPEGLSEQAALARILIW